MSKKQKVIETVFAQEMPFYSTTIQSLSGTSVALVSNTLNELLDAGKISAKKDGKKIVYALTDGMNDTQMTVTTEPICSMQEKFKYIHDIVQMVVDGVNPSAMITGRPGIGKTFLVKDTLKKAKLKEGEDYLFVSGHSSAFGLYRLLYEHQDEFIVLDDCDSVFKDPKSINILKSALDSYDVRRVSWFSDKTSDKEDIEPYFDFSGKVIFISNLHADRIDEAVRSRSFCVNLKMTNEEVTEHMRNIINDLEPNIELAIKQEVLDYISTISDCFETYGIRTLIQACRIRVGAPAEDDWKKMVRVITCNS